MDGAINAQLEGKTIHRAYKDGTHLLLETTDGHTVFIKWEEEEPRHVRTDVRVIFPGVSLLGGVWGAS